MKLAILSHGLLGYNGKEYRSQDLFGNYVEKLSLHFDEVVICAPIITKDSKIFANYAVHKFRSKNISICPLPTNRGDNPGVFSTTYKLIRQGIVILKEMKNWDLIYIFLPGYIAHIAFGGTKISHNPFFVYFASDWKEVSQSTYRWKGDIRCLLLPLYLVFNRVLYSLENIMAKRAIFVLVHGEKLYQRFKERNIHVYETVPMIKMTKRDLYYRVDTCRGDVIKLLFVGSLIRRKGIIYLINAINRMKDWERDLKVHLNIVGIGDQEDELIQYTETMRVPDLVSFLGYVPNGPELYKIYRESDIFILPTLGEGFPRVLYEAMGQSIPIVTTNVSGIPGLMKDRENALLIPPKSPRALVEAIRTIIKDTELRQRLIKNGQETVKGIVGLEPAKQMVSLLNKHFPR
jgi:glycosyltransferase involved in cell wall biosynthesis